MWRSNWTLQMTSSAQPHAIAAVRQPAEAASGRVEPASCPERPFHAFVAPGPQLHAGESKPYQVERRRGPSLVVVARTGASIVWLLARVALLACSGCPWLSVGGSPAWD
jgi:hypothetical protein